MTGTPKDTLIPRRYTSTTTPTCIVVIKIGIVEGYRVEVEVGYFVCLLDQRKIFWEVHWWVWLVGGVSHDFRDCTRRYILRVYLYTMFINGMLVECYNGAL